MHETKPASEKSTHSSSRGRSKKRKTTQMREHALGGEYQEGTDRTPRSRNDPGKRGKRTRKRGRKKREFTAAVGKERG